jgi:hypothetical protein
MHNRPANPVMSPSACELGHQTETFPPCKGGLVVAQPVSLSPSVFTPVGTVPPRSALHVARREQISDVEHLDCDAADRHATDKVGSLPPEVPHPFVPARVEQPGQFPRHSVPTANVSALEWVAPEATEGEVAGDTGPSMLPGDDAIDLERSVVVLLGQLAVFAAVIGPLPDQPSEPYVDERLIRASAFLVSP